MLNHPTKPLRAITAGSLLALCAPCAFGQWSNTYPIGTLSVVCAIAPDSTIITHGYLADLVGPQLMHIDVNGDTIATRTYDLPWTWTLSGGLCREADGNWLMAGQLVTNGEHGALFRFSTALDSLEMMTVQSSTMASFTSLDLSADSSIWAFGNSSTPQDLIAVRFNEQLVITDSARYITSSQEFCRNGIATLDGGFAVSGIRHQSFNDDDVHIVKADADGNVQWQRTLGDSRHELGGFIAQAPDSDYYVACGYSWDWPTYSRSTLVRLSTSGVPEWYCVVPTIGSSWLHSKPLITTSGKVLAAGLSILNGRYRGQLICANTSGTLLWQQVFATDTTEENYFVDIQQHPDGGFVLVGQAVDVQTGFESNWVVKTDSMGCLVPGCDAFDGILEQRTDLINALSFFPNPASDLVEVSISLPVGIALGKELSLALVNAQGSVVLKSRIPSGCTLHTLSLSQLSSGLYHLHLLDGRRWLSGEALVIQ